MELVFQCHQTGRIFRSGNYRIVDGRGIVVGADGRKVLDMRIQLTAPCPACGAMHIFAAKELACPLPGRSDDMAG